MYILWAYFTGNRPPPPVIYLTPFRPLFSLSPPTLPHSPYLASPLSLYPLFPCYSVTGQIRTPSLHQPHPKPSYPPAEGGGLDDDVEDRSVSSSYSASTERGPGQGLGQGSKITSVQAVHITIVGGKNVVQQPSSSSSSSSSPSSSSASASHNHNHHQVLPLSTHRYGSTLNTETISNNNNNNNNNNNSLLSPGQPIILDRTLSLTKPFSNPHLITPFSLS